MTKIPLSPRRGNIKSYQNKAVVKGCLIHNLEVVASPGVSCRFKMIETTVIALILPPWVFVLMPILDKVVCTTKHYFLAKILFLFYFSEDEKPEDTRRQSEVWEGLAEV